MRALNTSIHYWEALTDIALNAYRLQLGFIGFNHPQHIPAYLINFFEANEDALLTNVPIFRGNEHISHINFQKFLRLSERINEILGLPNADEEGVILNEFNGELTALVGGSSELAAIVFLHPRLSFIDNPHGNGRVIRVSN